jgi:hypothetical protein
MSLGYSGAATEATKGSGTLIPHTGAFLNVERLGSRTGGGNSKEVSMNLGSFPHRRRNKNTKLFNN